VSDVPGGRHEKMDIGRNAVEASDPNREKDVTALAFRIRKALATDGEAIVNCLRAAFEKYRKQYTPGAFADTVLDYSSVEERLLQMTIFVAVSWDTVIGTIGCAASGIEGHLRGMAVAPEHQGSGVAAALLQAAEQELSNNGCRYMTLDTTEPLTRAIRFYERYGFVRSGRVTDFFGMKLYEYRKALQR
jgi:ribosomal protein S18 acetylase RimI-like enzyme